MTREVPARARELAAKLAALFCSDQGIVARLSDAQRRLLCANDGLWSGLGPGALQQTHWAIHRAFIDYQSACEQRRQLAVDVGELSRQLSEVLCAAGWSEEAARNTDVYELAAAGGG